MKDPNPNRAEHALRIIWFLSYLITMTLILRFVLLLSGTAPDYGMAKFIYWASDPILVPVLMVLGQEPPYQPSMLQFSSLVAVPFYLVVLHSFVELTTKMIPVVRPSKSKS